MPAKKKHASLLFNCPSLIFLTIWTRYDAVVICSLNVNTVSCVELPGDWESEVRIPSGTNQESLKLVFPVAVCQASGIKIGTGGGKLGLNIM